MIAAELGAALAVGDQAKVDEVLARRKRHDDAVSDWRNLEQYYTTLARDDPAHYNVFYFDDTEKDACSFPHFTNRDLKSSKML